MKAIWSIERLGNTKSHSGTPLRLETILCCSNGWKLKCTCRGTRTYWESTNIFSYYGNLKFFNSRLVTKQSKLKLYRSVIKLIMTYASETWVLKEAIIQKLLVFERKILRRISGPTKENQIWRVKTNEELDKLKKHKNIINCINP